MSLQQEVERRQKLVEDFLNSVTEMSATLFQELHKPLPKETTK